MLHFEILVPVHNEEATLDSFFESVEPILDSLEKHYKVRTSYRFLDNLSTDKTIQVLRYWKEKIEREINVLSWIRNYGVMTSIYGGLHSTRADAVMVLDADLQDPPELITEFFAKFLEGYTFVCGKRTKRTEHFSIRLGRFLFRALYRLLRKDEDVPVESGAWLLDKSVIKDLIVNPPSTSYLAGALTSRGYRRATIPYRRNIRLAGKSKFSLFNYGKYAFEGLASSPVRLMRVALFSSFFLNILILILFLFFIASKFIFGANVLGGITLILFIQVFSFSLITMLLGLIGEYLSRVFQNTARLEIPTALDAIK
jgi:dolichol-phosphate mannosyltransferase